MHQPRPHGLLVVGGALTEEDSAAIELLARRLTNLRQVSGINSLRMVRSLPDGGYAVAQDMGGVFRVIAHKPETAPPPPPFEGIANDYIPMLFSGVVTKPIVAAGEGVSIKLTEQTRFRLGNYDLKNKISKELSLQRFRISYGTDFLELAPKDSSDLFYSQYTQQRPTWYSGAMAEVVQIVGGYGRQSLGELPNTPMERAQLLIPSGVKESIRQQVGNVRLPGYTGQPNKDGQFQYDYKFNRTDGVGFDSKKKPWLIRVASNGVWAMPLPTIAVTTTQAFREYIEKVGDKEILEILDRFGGMPSGETFPSKDSDFQAWRRAGVIIKICDVLDFYDHISYSSACGWSFNSNGTEGFNTCYDYYDDEGLGYGLAYKLKLNLVGSDGEGKLPPLEVDDENKRQSINAYLSELYKLLKSNDAVSLAIKYKLRRVEPGEILARITGADIDQGEVDYWNALELPPIASHSGNVSEVGRGYLYHPAKFMVQPQIKFPEPDYGGCVSHDFLPLINGANKDGYPKCDTIMFGYYIDDQLKVVKYFREDRKYSSGVESDYEDCMIVGEWSQTESGGSSQLMGNFYTSDFDDRRSVPPNITKTNIIGKDLGYDSKPFFEFDAPFWMPGTLWRNRYFSRKITTNYSEGNSLNVAICIPYLCRNAILHAHKESFTSGRISVLTEMGAVRDPWSYRYWTYDVIMHWAGGLPVEKGRPSPKDSVPVWVEIEEYKPTQCSDFADNGSWIKSLPADYTWLIHPQSKVYYLSGGGGPPQFNPTFNETKIDYTESGNLKINILDQPDTVHSNVPDPMYFLGSPDPYGGVFLRTACKVVFGKSIYANVSETVGTESFKSWGYTSLADNKSAHPFIGVINE